MTVGLLLVIDYQNTEIESFNHIAHTLIDTRKGWCLRGIHARGASAFFLFVYFHIGRGIYYSSYRLKEVWLRGVRILLCLMAISFLGYVLP